ncbi:MAG: PKD domain-containing protein [Baekduia sp.]
MRVHPTAIATIAATVACAAPAAADLPMPTWQTPVAVTAPGEADGQGIIGYMTPSGDLFAGWAISNGGQQRLKARFRRAGGDWGPTQFISENGETPTGVNAATTADGDLLLGLTVNDGSTWKATVRRLDRDSGTWGPQETLSDPNVASGGTNFTTAPDGTTYAIYNGDRVYLRALAPGSSEWGPPEPVNSAPGYDPAIVALPDGSLTAGWREQSGGSQRQIVAERAAGSQSWGPPTDLTVGAPDSGYGLKFAVNAAGDQLGAIWIQQTGSSPNWVSKATFARRLNGTWTAAEQAPEAQSVSGWLGFDASDSLIVTWISTDGMSYGSGHTSIGRDDSAFAAPAAFGDGNGMTVVPSFAQRPDGSIFGAQFSGSSFMDIHVGTTVREPLGTSWADDTEFAGETISLLDGAGIGADAHGDVAMAWERADGTLVIATGDGAPPAISDVEVPATATVGEQVPVSASAFDVLSDVDSVSWDFGDGARKTGESASHAYSAAGTYSVRVTATDAVGHSATQTRQLVVSAPPAPPARDDNADDSDDPKPPVVIPPVIEARLSGRTITLNAKLTLKKGKRCSGTVRATTAFGGRTYKTTLRLATKNGACRATGTIKLKKTPSLRTKLRVTVSGAQAKSRTLTTRRG